MKASYNTKDIVEATQNLVETIKKTVPEGTVTSKEKVVETKTTSTPNNTKEEKSFEEKEIITTYGGNNNTSKDMTKGTPEVVGNTTIEVKAEPSKEKNTYNEEVEKAQENSTKEVQQGKDNETVVIEDKTTEDKKVETNNEYGSTNANWEQLLENAK